MTEQTVKETTDVLLSYLVKKNSSSFGLCAVGGVLLRIDEVSHTNCSNDVTKWDRKDVLSVLDSLAFNGISADIRDMREGHRNYFDELWLEARKKASVSLYGEVSVGGESCVVSAEQQLYFGRNIEAYGGLGMCAERVALMQALSQGDSCVNFILTCDAEGRVRRPCGACLEFMAQVGLNDTWIAMDKGLWIPMRKVGWYASLH